MVQMSGVTSWLLLSTTAAALGAAAAATVGPAATATLGAANLAPEAENLAATKRLEGAAAAAAATVGRAACCHAPVTCTCMPETRPRSCAASACTCTRWPEGVCTASSLQMQWMGVEGG